MSFQKLVLAGVLGFTSVSISTLVATPAQAACLTTAVPAIDNNCQTYDTTASPTRAILRFADTNSATDTNWQITASTISVANLSDWEYGPDGSSWTSFNPSFSVAPNTGGLGQISTIFTTSTTPSAPTGNPFFLRVKLSDTATINSPFSFTILTNPNGSTDSFGQLNTGFGIGSSNSRNFTRVADPVTSSVPGPLPLMGALAAFSYSRKLRKAIRSGG